MRVWCKHCGAYHEDMDIVGTYDDVPTAPCVLCAKPVKGASRWDYPVCFHCANQGKMPYIQ